jgi:iron complex transport system permease protein
VAEHVADATVAESLDAKGDQRMTGERDRDESGQAPARRRRSGSFATPGKRVQFVVVLTVLIVLSVAFTIGLLMWDNPIPWGDPRWWIIARSRFDGIIAMAIVACSQAIATVAFQTATSNRIITPSILGFDSLYVAVQTTAIYVMGISGVVMLQGVAQFALMVALMLGLPLGLFGWLLSGRYGNLHVMLLVGIVIGGGLGSVSAFMQRLLTPSEFDVLTARMFGSVSNADTSYYPLAIPLCVIAGGLLLARARVLNLVALGRDMAKGLGINHRAEVIRILVLVSVLMAVSTALVGRMTFLGFLVAMLAYQLSGTEDHRYVLPISMLCGYTVLTGAYFLMRNVFSFASVVSIAIEFVGGIIFLAVILKRGRL